MNGSKILLIEDEENVRIPLEDYLRREGFTLSSAISCSEARKKIQSSPYDLILLDWMLPDGQGIDLIRSWRSEGIQTPALFLTARAELVDKVLGLELGANDYMTKPFEPRELLARIRVHLRGKGTRASDLQPSFEVGGIVFNLSERRVRFRGREVELKKTEFELLRLFIEYPNQVFSREELLKKVWGYDSYPTTRTVDTHILQLRQKFAAELFETVHGIGYRFRVPRI